MTLTLDYVVDSESAICDVARIEKSGDQRYFLPPLMEDPSCEKIARAGGMSVLYSKSLILDIVSVKPFNHSLNIGCWSTFDGPVNSIEYTDS